MPPRTREQAERALGAYKRPAINFNKRDNFREFAGSGMGQNYHKMMDLQRQAPTFQKNDPRIDNLKQRRRQFNRYDKNNAGSIFGYTPQEMQEDYRFESGELRNRAKPVYNKMYPLTSGFMDIAEKGGILGAILSGIGNMSRDKGLPSLVDDSEEEVANYVNNTFKPNMADVAGQGTTFNTIEGPGESEVIYSPNAPTFYDRGEGLDFDTDLDQPYVAPDDYVEDDFDAFYNDADTLASERPMPFDDSARERAIMEQYPESFIGPRDDPSRRPDIFDVAGKGIKTRGLFSYPSYLNDFVTLEQHGRGELPNPNPLHPDNSFYNQNLINRDFDYDQSRKDRVDNYRLDQLLQQISQEEETPPPFSIGATR